MAAFAEARALLLQTWTGCSWGTAAPADGAFYLYADLGDQLSGFADSADYCRALLEEEGVALVPGADFDAVSGTRSVRLSFAAGADAVARPWNGSSGSKRTAPRRADLREARGIRPGQVSGGSVPGRVRHQLGQARSQASIGPSTTVNNGCGWGRTPDPEAMRGKSAPPVKTSA